VLEEHAKRIISSLDVNATYVGDYVGLRPGTDKRDYQIHTFSRSNWIAAAGIRSTGLTASLGIGRHVVHLLSCILPEPLPRQVKTTPLPNVLSLVDQYHKRGDGTVCIDGSVYKVTHPITKFGWERRSGMANPGHRLSNSKL
jgi:glycerol-3-phosphate dehydrogenase